MFSLYSFPPRQEGVRIAVESRYIILASFRLNFGGKGMTPLLFQNAEILNHRMSQDLARGGGCGLTTNDNSRFSRRPPQNNAR